MSDPVALENRLRIQLGKLNQISLAQTVLAPGNKIFSKEIAADKFTDS